MPAPATSARTQPMPAAPLSSPTWTGTVASPGSSAHAAPGPAVDRSHSAARRAPAREAGARGVAQAPGYTPGRPRPPPAQPAGQGEGPAPARPARPPRGAGG